MSNYATVHQRQPLRTPASWSADEKKLIIQLEDVLDDIYRRFGRLALQDLAVGLRKQLTDDHGNISTLVQTATEFSNKIENIEGDYSKLTQTVEGFSTRVGTVEGNYSELSQTVGGFSTRVSSIEGSYSELTQTVEGFSTRVGTVEGNYSELSQTVGGFSARISSVEGGFSEMTQTLEEFRTRIETAEGDFSEFQQTVEGFEARVKDAQGALSTYQQTVAGFEATVEDAEGAISEYQQTVAGFETKVENAEGALATYQQTVAGFETKVENAEGALSTYQQTVAGFETKVENAEGALATYQQTVAGFETKVENAEGALTSYQQTIQSFTSVVQSLEGDLSSYQQTVEGFTAQVEDAEGKISAFQQTVNGFTSRVTDLETAQSTLTQTVNSFEARVHSLEGKTPDTLVNTSMRLDKTGIYMSGGVLDMEAGTNFRVKSGGAVQIDAKDGANSFIRLGDGKFNATQNGDVTAKTGDFDESLMVRSQPVWHSGNAIVSVSKPDAHGVLWIQPSVASQVRYAMDTGPDRNHSLPGTHTYELTTSSEDVIAASRITYTLSIPVYEIQGTNQYIYIQAQISKAGLGTIYFPEYTLVRINQWELKHVQISVESEVNLLSNTSPIQLTLVVVGSDTGGLYLQRGMEISLVANVPGASADAQPCLLHWIP